MKGFKIIIAILLVAYAPVVFTDDDCTPKQIHLSLGEKFYNGPRNTTDSVGDNEIANIVWVTETECEGATVEILPFKSTKEPFKFIPVTVQFSTDIKGWKTDIGGHYSRYSHTVKLSDKILPNWVHYVKINGVDVFNFTIPDLDLTDSPLTFIWYADIDTNQTNFTSKPTIERIASMLNDPKEGVNFTIIGGDIAYDLVSKAGQVGDDFMNNIQNITTTRPVMITPGNHDSNNGDYGILNYRYQMPNYKENHNQYYSYDVGPVHFVSFNADWFEYNPFNVTITNETLAYNRNLTLEWLKNDLILADAPDNRTERPWIIVYSHRPIYCSYNAPTDKELNRCYNFFNRSSDLDEILHNSTVDLFISGHVHSYERTGPIYKNETVLYENVTDASGIQTITNANATIYVVDGAAGNSYFMPNTSYDPANYSLKTDIEVGFTKFEVHGKTVLKMQHIKSSDGTVVDQFFLRKDRHLNPSYPQYGVYFLIAASILIVVFIALAIIWYYKHRKEVESRGVSEELEAPISRINQEKTRLNPYERGL